jgi:phospholipase C
VWSTAAVATGEVPVATVGTNLPDAAAPLTRSWVCAASLDGTGGSMHLRSVGRRALPALVLAAGLAAGVPAVAHHGSPPDRRLALTAAETGDPATTPIRHVVVIFDENVSFDHYFGTYPVAANPPGEPPFHALAGTPTVNGLDQALLEDNPNLSNPQRLDRSQALTCDQDHAYSAEQSAFDHGLMDRFVQDTGNQTDDTVALCTGKATGTAPNYTVMDYYDGNTVTAMWNYAQHFAMSDNAYGSAFGPSSPGALELAAGTTYGAVCGPTGGVYGPVPLCPPTTVDGRTVPYSLSATPGSVAPAGPGTEYDDRDPYYDECSQVYGGGLVAMGGTNIGDLLDSKGVTWGWFQGGFADGYVPGDGRPLPSPGSICSEAHANIGGATVTDYIPHHDPFQFYASTANPEHLPPTSVAVIGRQDQANHQYGLGDFWAAADSGHLPAVSFLKPPGYEDGHPGYSDPLDEQHFVAATIDRLESLPTWRSTAVIITYDDTDGWYDQQMSPILVQSQTALDSLSGTDQCGANPARVPTSTSGASEEARCGLGPRMPFLVISPWARPNFVDNQIIDQSSIARFIEDDFGLGRIGDGSTDAIAGSITPVFDFSQRPNPVLLLDPVTGEPVRHLPPAAELAAYSQGPVGAGGPPKGEPGAASVADGPHGAGPERPGTSAGGPVVTLHPEGSWWPERLTAAQEGAPAPVA